METFTQTILSKWRAQGVFYRYVDCDRKNTSAKNLKQVTLREALAHINDWVCDWDDDLTPQEIQVVHNSAWRASLRW
jgi:hypothetical protein